MKNIYQKDELILANVLGAVSIIGGLLLLKGDLLILPVLLMALGVYYLFFTWGTKIYSSKNDNRAADFFNSLSGINYYILGVFGIAIMIVFLINNVPGMLSVIKNHHWVALIIIAIAVAIIYTIRFILTADFDSSEDNTVYYNNPNSTSSQLDEDEDNYGVVDDEINDDESNDCEFEYYKESSENYSDDDSSFSEEGDSDVTYDADAVSDADTPYDADAISDTDTPYDADAVSDTDTPYDADVSGYEMSSDESYSNDSYSDDSSDIEKMKDLDSAINNLFDDDSQTTAITEDLVESSNSEAAKALKRIRERVSSPEAYLAKKKNNKVVLKEYADDINKGQVEIPYYLKKKLISYCPDCGAQLEGDFLLCENCGGVMRQKHVDVE